MPAALVHHVGVSASVDALSDQQLIELELDTLWRRRSRKIIEAENVSQQTRRALLVVGWTGSSRVIAVGNSVRRPAKLLDSVQAATSREFTPDNLVHIRESLTAEFGEIHEFNGQSFVIAPTGAPRPDIACIHGMRTDSLRGRVPEEERQQIFGPWSAAVAGDEVAAYCSTARDSAHAVEAGLYAYPQYRGRGYGLAATREWCDLVKERTAFYRARSDNGPSLTIAQRLAVRRVASWWEITAQL